VCGDYEPPSPVVLVAMKHIQPRITRMFTVNRINKPAPSLSVQNTRWEGMYLKHSHLVLQFQRS
jgi:hypothetical protein